MSFAKRFKETMQAEYAGKKSAETDFGAMQKARLIDYRKPTHSVVRLGKPSNVVRARELGYKAKQGIIVVRVRIRKGSGTKTRPNRGRRPKRMGVEKLTRKQSIQGMAEGRASSKYPNLEVLNSYWVGEDGRHKYYEAILVDPSHPSICADKDLKWISWGSHRGRQERGLTSAGLKSRSSVRQKPGR